MPTLFRLIVTFSCALLAFNPVNPALGQKSEQPLAIILKTTPVNVFSAPPPVNNQSIKPAFKDKSVALKNAINGPALLALTSPLSSEEIKLLEKNKFLLRPKSVWNQPPSANKASFDEMLYFFDHLGGDFQLDKRAEHNARFVGPDVFLHAFNRYLTIRLQAAEAGPLRQLLGHLLEELVTTAIFFKNQTDGKSSAQWERLAAQLVVPLILVANGQNQPDYSKDPAPPADTFEKAKELFQPYRPEFSKSLAQNIIIELERVYQGKGQVVSLLGLTAQGGGEIICYDLFHPKAPYQHREDSRAYFRAKTWLSQLGWDLSSDEGLADALNFVLALSHDQPIDQANLPQWWETAVNPDWKAPPEARQAWATVMEFDAFFYGQAKTVGLHQWLPFLMKEAGVAQFTIETAADDMVLKRLAAASPPLTPFLGSQPAPSAQRKTVLSIFPPRAPLAQRLQAELVGRAALKGEAPLYSGLYLSALLGQQYARQLVAGQIHLDWDALQPSPDRSKQAQEIIRKQADSLTAALDALATKVAQEPDQYWSSSLEAAWLRLLSTQTHEYSLNFPRYMQSEAFQAKQLETILGSLTERLGQIDLGPAPAHSSLEEKVSEGVELPPSSVVKGFVEPNLDFWREMIRITKYTAGFFQKYELFPEDIQNNGSLNRFLKRLERCAIISEKELIGQTLTEDDYEFIRLFSLDFMASPVDNFYGQPSAAQTAAIGTALKQGPEASVSVFAATGEPQLMLVLVGNDQTPRLTVGLAFNHYELVAPPGFSLSQEVWRNLVSGRGGEGQKPLPPKNFWYDPLAP